MIVSENVLVVDIDGTLAAEKKEGQNYIDLLPNIDFLNKLIDYKQKGFYIILFTARQMRSHQGNLGKINANTAKIIFEWLEKHDIPYDEIYFGKPWCGNNGFYIDDKAIRPSEFLNLSFEEISSLLDREKK